MDSMTLGSVEKLGVGGKNPGKSARKNSGVRIQSRDQTNTSGCCKSPFITASYTSVRLYTEA